MDNSVIVSLRDIVVDFDGQRILNGLNLDIHDKEFVTLLGSSGCGKTTTLRLIAGFLEPNAGTVSLHGKDITGVPPYKRPVNTVFQKYALFPHLNVFENVAFGLRLKHLDEETIRTKCGICWKWWASRALSGAASPRCRAASSSGWQHAI